MPRCRKHRCCRMLEGEKIFKPRAVPMDGLEISTIALDELEAMRLCDHEHLSQIEAAERMGISRGTVQRLLDAGRYRLLNALLHDHAIKLSNV